MHEEPELDLSHLLPSVQVQARLPADERIRHVRAERWIGYPRALAALERLETLFSWPSRQRMPNLLLIGPTNNGKSMLIEKFRRSHPPRVLPDREDLPVLCVQMPSEPSVSRFYMALLAALGAPLVPRQRFADLERLALTLLRAVGVRMLIIVGTREAYLAIRSDDQLENRFAPMVLPLWEVDGETCSLLAPQR